MTKSCRHRSALSPRFCVISMRRSSGTIRRMWLDSSGLFAAVFLNDGSSVFECHIDLSELGKIISHEVFDFVAGRLFLGRREV